jgi:membrane associated rhomboid family serine protease
MSLPPLPSFRWLSLSRGDHLILGLIALCTLIELILSAADLGFVGTVRWRTLWIENAAFWAGLLRDWQPNYAAQPWLMFGTYAFLHVGPMHLLGNMLALIWLGPVLQARLGRRGFCLLWLAAASGGALCFALLSTTPAPMVGASGAVFGLLGALVALDYLDRGDLSAVLSMTALLAGLNLVTFIFEKGGLAWETHLGGYLAGILAVAALDPGRHHA